MPALRYTRLVAKRMKAKGQQCSESECGLPVHAKGLCAKHYQVWKRVRTDVMPCTHHEGCSEPRYAKDLCLNHYNAQRMADPDRRAKKLSQDAVYRASLTDEDKAETAAYNKAYRAAKAAEIKAQRAEHYVANKPTINARNNKAKKDNPEAINAINGNRRALKKGAPGKWTRADKRAIYEMAGNKCERCGATECLTLDHIVPLARETSTNWPCNLQVLCQSCNSKKNEDWVEIWVAGELLGRMPAPPARIKAA